MRVGSSQALAGEHKICERSLRNDSSSITYVKNRVADIREMSNNYKIFHVPTTDNPADFVTRGVKANDLVINSFRFKGSA